MNGTHTPNIKWCTIETGIAIERELFKIWHFQQKYDCLQFKYACQLNAPNLTQEIRYISHTQNKKGKYIFVFFLLLLWLLLLSFAVSD